MSMNALEKYAELYVANPALEAADAARSGAYLINGTDEDGLKTLARLLAAKLCGFDYGQAFKEHADIIVYPKPAQDEKKQKSKKQSGERSKRYGISVDDIREIIDSLYLTPFESDKRVFIIESAESMSEICQNKLLKSLEEPPRAVCFILCATGKLLPTVESRCNRIDLPPFDIAVAEAALLKHHSDKTAVRLAARASMGNLGLAERILADGEFAHSYDAAKRILALATGSRMFVKTAAVYDKFTRDRTDAVLGIMEYLTADVARLLIGVPTVFDEADVRAVSVGFTPLSAANCAEHIRSARMKNAANCMSVAVMDTLILKIMEEKALCRK